jgi:hypothetical protein
VVWYAPSWYLRGEAGKTMPSYLVEYDTAGRELTRRTVPPAPLVEPPRAQASFGLVTSLAEAAVLVGGAEAFPSRARLHGGTELEGLWYLLVLTARCFIPGVGWEMAPDDGIVAAFRTLILLSALAVAAACFLLARRHGFSRVRCIGWCLCGLVFGPAGLLLLLALHEWPARIACPGCRKPRAVTRDTCEHCGAAHASPATDGTEIFEEITAAPQAALAGR